MRNVWIILLECSQYISNYLFTGKRGEPREKRLKWEEEMKVIVKFFWPPQFHVNFSSSDKLVQNIHILLFLPCLSDFYFPLVFCFQVVYRSDFGN